MKNGLLKEENNMNEAQNVEVDNEHNLQNNEEETPGSESIDDVMNEIITEGKNAKNVPWYNMVPKKEQFKPGDIVYHEELARFGIFVRPAKKEGLIRARLFKIGTKNELYTRDWFLDFEDITLVKRNGKVKRGFVETANEFAIRVGRKLKEA